MLIFAARELEIRPGDVKEAVRGFISGLCDPETLQALDDLGVVIPQEGKTVCETADTESPCAKQWNLAYEESPTTGSFTDAGLLELRELLELSETFYECSSYLEWERNKNRVGGQSPNTLEDGCMLENLFLRSPRSPVVRDAMATGVLTQRCDRLP